MKGSMLLYPVPVETRAFEVVGVIGLPMPAKRAMARMTKMSAKKAPRMYMTGSLTNSAILVPPSREDVPHGIKDEQDGPYSRPDLIGIETGIGYDRLQEGDLLEGDEGDYRYDDKAEVRVRAHSIFPNAILTRSINIEMICHIAEPKSLATAIMDSNPLFS